MNGPDQNDDLPQFTSMATSAVSMHELFTSWVEAGFTPEQALYLLAQMLIAAQRSNQG